MESFKKNNEFEQSSTEGESRPASGIDCYEDDFERGLEEELSCHFDDEKVNGKFGIENEVNGIWESYPRKIKPPEEDKEKSNGLLQHFQREEQCENVNKRGSQGTITNFFQRWTSQTSINENSDSYFDAAEEVGYDMSSLDNMDPEERAKLEEEWKNDLAKTEDEIQTLKLVLNSKMRHAQELKTKLGISVWKEFRCDMEQGIKNVKDSDVFQKTESVLKTATEKTSTAIGTLSASMTKKIGDVKNSPTFKSFEEVVGNAYANVKTKVTGSRSSSMPSFEEAYGNNTYPRSAGATPATTPIIPEEKPLS